MSALRAFLRDHRALALLVAMLALCVKFAVPQGYMLSPTTRFLSVQVCFDGTQHRTATIAIPMDGKRQGGEHHGGDDRQPDGKCAFTALGMGALGGADAPLLLLALAFILAMGFAPVSAVRRGWTAYLRPPLRGPPTLA